MIFLSCYSLIKNDCDGRCQGCPILVFGITKNLYEEDSDV